MAISTPKLAIIGSVLVLSTLFAYFLLYASIIPQYSVYEFYMDNNPEQMVDKKIQLVGDVMSIGTDEFVIGDWETNGSLTVMVTHHNVVKPAGFELQKRVMIEGTLKKVGNSYYLEATLISTKCPSKYQNTN